VQRSYNFNVPVAYVCNKSVYKGCFSISLSNLINLDSARCKIVSLIEVINRLLA
jgi:hypothetical protein